MSLTRFGQAPVPMTLAPLPAQAALPGQMRVIEHRVGYTEVVLENGDLLHVHLYVDEFILDEATRSFSPKYRVISEFIMNKDRENFDPLPRPLS